MTEAENERAIRSIVSIGVRITASIFSSWLISKIDDGEDIIESRFDNIC